MVDPLSTAASVAGLLALGGSIVNLSRMLYIVAKDMKHAKKDVLKFAEDIGLFGDVIALAYYFLEEYCAVLTKSSLLLYIKEHNLLPRLMSRTRKIFRRIDELYPQISNFYFDQNMGLISRFIWARRKVDIQAIRPDMEATRTSFNLILLMVRLEQLYTKKVPANSKEL